ncbi:hypothetical protein F8M41_004011 [Gigaspora margarita]|uniref:Uncharacterized protein n=1 Tax=Gigaspora margarita TaxID=4874 RepID=A0A8H3XB36_GIGMA|nr:hypothetical protein F8M41_004011 [Gigaspora margarita]
MFTLIISLTQQRVTNLRVNIPEIYISNPININPNSLANIEKVLVHIEKISGIKDRICKNIDLKRFAVCQEYRTKNQLSYFKRCADYHKSWDSICNIYHQAMAMKLLWPYVKSHSNPSVEEYLVWAKEQQSPLYQIKYEQLMQLYSEIRDFIEKNCFVSRSGIYEQHQGLDAIIEELRNNLFKTIGYNDQQSVPRTQPESAMEFQRFRVLLRSLEFPIPITKKEAILQNSEENMTNNEILAKIETFLEQLGENA